MNTVRNMRTDSIDALEEAFANAPLREARARSELHSFFQEKMDPTVDDLLSRVSGGQEGGVSDVERLRSFLALRTIADSTHVGKFRLVLTSERHESRWRYEFRVGDAILYTSDTLNVGSGLELAEYEDEYIFQLFPLSIEPETIRRELMAVGDRVGGQIFGDAQRLERFKNLANTALPEHIDRFKREVLIDSTNKKWAYKLSIGGICLCHRDGLDTESSNDFGVFQHAELLQRFRKVLRGNGSEPDVLLMDAVFKFEKCVLGLEVSLAKNFCAMAAIAKTAHWEEASIELVDSLFRLKYDGKTLFQADVPSSFDQSSLGARVHITILALELALLSVEANFRAIIQNLDRQQLLAPGVVADQAKRLTLGQAIHAVTDKHGEIRVKRMMGAEKGAASYELSVMSSPQGEKFFSGSIALHYIERQAQQGS